MLLSHDRPLSSWRKARAMAGAGRWQGAMSHPMRCKHLLLAHAGFLVAWTYLKPSRNSATQGRRLSGCRGAFRYGDFNRCNATRYSTEPEAGNHRRPPWKDYMGAALKHNKPPINLKIVSDSATTNPNNSYKVYKLRRASPSETLTR